MMATHQFQMMVILKMVDEIGLNQSSMQNDITKDSMRDVLIFMEMTKEVLAHMHTTLE